VVRELNHLAATARTLLARGGTLESSSGSGPIDDGALRDAASKTLRQIIAARPGDTNSTSEQPDEATKIAASGIVARARAALKRVDTGDPASTLAAEDVSALELIVRTVGRPALRFNDGQVDMPPNTLGDNSRWQVLVATARKAINDVAGRVGRIACERGYAEPVLGTGWRIGDDLLVSNRHVAQLLVAQPNSAPSAWQLDPMKAPFVDFAYTDGNANPVRCNIAELVYCAEDRWVDLAVFRVARESVPPPPPLQIDWDIGLLGREIQASGGGSSTFQGGEVYTIGHPYQQTATDPTRNVFGDADGRKRCSPGLVNAVDNDLPTFLHDCSTLGGHSGSCVISLESAGHAVVGLHFGGREDEATLGSGLGLTNYAIALGRLAEHKHRAAGILRGDKS
jgi:hypothetical protein